MSIGHKPKRKTSAQALKETNAGNRIDRHTKGCEICKTALGFDKPQPYFLHYTRALGRECLDNCFSISSLVKGSACYQQAEPIAAWHLGGESYFKLYLRQYRSVMNGRLRTFVYRTSLRLSIEPQWRK